MKKIHYDYAIGLDTPYWIQEIRLRGKLFWSFQTPLSVAFVLVALGSSGVLYLLVVHPFISVLKHVPFVPVGLCTVVPWKIGKLYVEYEPDGKKMHQFLWGSLRFMKDFAWDKRCIHGEQRRKEVTQKIVFERVQL